MNRRNIFTADKHKNILWKVRVLGWSLSHPIEVGKKVFAVGEPDFVTCWNLDTGKQLWQRWIMPLLCDGLSEDKAAAVQKVLDLARALWPPVSNFSRMGCMVPVGNRLLIQSSAFLYCIGEKSPNAAQSSKLSTGGNGVHRDDSGELLRGHSEPAR